MQTAPFIINFKDIFFLKVVFTLLQTPENIRSGRSAMVKWAATWQNQQNECAPSEDSDQPGHPPSLIRVFAVSLKKAQVLSCPLSTQWRLWSELGPGWSESSLGAQSLCWFCYVTAHWERPRRKVGMLALQCKGCWFPMLLQSFEWDYKWAISWDYGIFHPLLTRFQMHMCSHPIGLAVWVLVKPFVYFYTSCVRTAKALARLRGCAGSPEPLLVAYVISTIISCAGSNRGPVSIYDWLCPFSDVFLLVIIGFSYITF